MWRGANLECTLIRCLMSCILHLLFCTIYINLLCYLTGQRLVSAGSISETSSIIVQSVTRASTETVYSALPRFTSDASKVTSKGAGLAKAYIGQKSSFTVDCSKAGKNSNRCIIRDHPTYILLQQGGHCLLDNVSGMWSALPGRACVPSWLCCDLFQHKLISRSQTMIDHWDPLIDCVSALVNTELCTLTVLVFLFPAREKDNRIT